MEGLDDEHDVDGNPVNSDRRVRQLFNAIAQLKVRENEGFIEYHSCLFILQSLPY